MLEIRERQNKERVEKRLVTTEKGKSVTLVGWIKVRNDCVILCKMRWKVRKCT